MFLIVLSSFGFAFEYNNSIPLEPTTSVPSTTNKRGMQIQPLIDFELKYIIKSPSSTATKCYIYQSSTLINSSNFIGNNCTVNTQLTKGIKYNITVDNSGSAYNGVYSSYTTYPVNSSNLTWTASLDGGTLDLLYTRELSSLIIADINNFTINLLYPKNGLTLNAPFNFTYTTSFNSSNCSLWTNTSGTWKVNQTKYGINLTVNNTFEFNTLPSDGSYIWNVQCNNTYWALSNYTFNIDTSTIIITKLNNNSLSEINGTKISNYKNNLTASFNLFDAQNNLNSYNLTIYNSSNNKIFTQNYSATGGDYNFSNVLNISNYNIGNYTLSVYVKDNVGNNNYIDYTFEITSFIEINITDIIDNQYLNYTLNINNIIKNSTNGLILNYSNISKGNNLLYFYGNNIIDFNQTVEINNSYHLLNYKAYTANSIFINFIDSQTKQIINTSTIYLNLISNIYATNRTTTNGQLYLKSIPPAEYEFIYTSTNYSTNFFYYTLVQDTYANINLSFYLTNNISTELIIATVYDGFNKEIQGVKIKIYQYDLLTNSYFIVGQTQSNFEGKAQLNLIKNTELYKFYLYYPSDTLKIITNPTYIYSDTINFQIILNEIAGINFDYSQNIYYNLYNSSNSFIVEYIDNNNEIKINNACLDIYSYKYGIKTLINTSCSTLSSDTLISSYTIINSTTYIAEFTTYIPDEYLLSSKQVSYYDAPPFGTLGIFLIFILTAVCALVMIPNLSLGVILTPMPMVLGSYFRIINIDNEYTILIEVIAIIVAIVIAYKTNN